MIENSKMEKLRTTAALISSFMDMDRKYKNKDFEYFELAQIINDIMDSTFSSICNEFTKEERNFIVNKIRESKPVTFNKIEGICLDNNRKWFTDEKNRMNDYFERYYRYLINKKDMSPKAVKHLSEKILDPIMNQLGNPKSQYFGIHGLVMGDVQSGKTMTYVGLINKAVDAGYKLIIILTGTVESLRKQTQDRIDLGFTGFDSDTENVKDGILKKETRFVGVGLDSLRENGTRYATSFTTKKEDFNSTLANGICTSLDQLKRPAIMVIKKNVKILERVYQWLAEQHDLIGEDKLDFPLLMIDDESDNASINTKDEDSDPTKTNARIRNILKIFNKYSYVGFTATPFANIFIDPNIYREDYGKDLFPSDFIFSLTPNDSYIGAKDIFLDGAKYNNSLIFNDDCEKVLPPYHKKEFDFNRLPNSLREAIILFTISNVIRDLRGDKNQHRAMLINISRFTFMHEKIKDVVYEFFKSLCGIYFTFSKIENKNKVMIEVEEVFKKHYFNCEFKWNDIKINLYNSNKNVNVLKVNKDSEMINYKEYEKEGSRSIFIGGLSLSRGLTLEGLCISYFFRYSKTYDVLLQMGRWFGYRTNYDDLFRIYIPEELVGWYSVITESVEELKKDLNKMRLADKKPNEYGIRVKNDSTTLKLTSSNKMRTAVSNYKTVIGFGEIIATGDIIDDVNINEYNLKKVVEILGKYLKSDSLCFEKDQVSNNTILRNVSFSCVLEIVKNFEVSPANDLFEKDSLIEFLNRFSSNYFKTWDIAFIEGRKSADDNIYSIEELGLNIHKTSKKFDKKYNYIRIQKSREQLNNPTDTTTGLNLEQFKRISNYFKSSNKSNSISSISGKRWLDVVDRKPILMIYLIELDRNSNDDVTLNVIDKYHKANVPPIGIALGIPEYENQMTERELYKINIVEQRRLRELAYNYQYYDESEEEE